MSKEPADKADPVEDVSPAQEGATAQSESSVAVAERAEPKASPEEPKRRITSLEVLCGLLVVALIGQQWLASWLDVPAIQTGSTIFVAVCVQALPFLVLGVMISGAIAAFVPARVLEKMLPKKQAFAVPVAGMAGVALPTCECAAVPVARRLMQQGVPTSVALAFLLAAPAVNPIVLVATSVAFPNSPGMVAARLAGSLATAIIMGWLWARFGKAEWIIERALRRLPEQDGRSRWRMFFETSRADLVDAGGFLVIGGFTAAVLNVAIPREWINTLGEQIILGVIVMAVLAVLLALCSEADAFVAASIAGMPLLPKLVFLVVGPAIDVKLFALQAGTFGKSFAMRFAPATFIVAVACAVISGVIFLGGVG
ncbi:permease [Actinokineospora xionganensis]|uniref:Permease n=1 Tax=Actinokineospora xionganensis TaxID=2684470 RepID=A0ABR7LAN7_9PSEU|nr:permease [Actinokineospora xionganensis]MBC6449628.1 permease [Actinokineospora xionganensis]